MTLEISGSPKSFAEVRKLRPHAQSCGGVPGVGGRLCQQIQAFLFDYAELSRELNIAGALVDKRHDAEYPQTAYGQPLPLMVPWKFLLTRLSQVNHLRQFNALVDNVDTTTQTTRQSTVLTPLTGGPARPMLRFSN